MRSLATVAHGVFSARVFSARVSTARVFSARGRTLALSALLVGTVACIPALPARMVVPGTPVVPVVVLALVFAAGGLLVFDVEFRQHAQSHTLTDLPLVMGLFLMTPGELVAARVIGECIVLLLRRRPTPMKMLLNGCLLFAECSVALGVFFLVFGAPDARSPAGWFAALVSVVAMDVFSMAVISQVIRWHGGHAEKSWATVAVVSSGVVNCSLGVTATLLLYQHAAATLLLAVITGLVYVGCRAFAHLQQRYASLQLLHEFSEAIGSALRPDDVMESMLRYARRLLLADVAELVVLGAADDEPGIRVTLRGELALSQTSAHDLEALRPAIESCQSVVVPRGAAGALAEHLSDMGCRDGVFAPLRLGDDVGVFLVADRHREVTTFSDNDARVFQTLANHAVMALEKGRLIEKLRAEAARREYQALHDLLTGLPNRASFLDAVERSIHAAEANGGTVAVLLMDLDHFKDINDTLGHDTGDLLLQEIGLRLRRATRTQDVAARLGGDEFALLVESDAVEAADAFAARILAAVEEPVDLNHLLLDVRASIGIARWPDDGADVATLMQRADVAMYAAKAAGTGVESYRAEVDHNTPRRLTLAAELRRALAERQLTVHYQPKADLQSGRISGAEALVRWNHPVLGSIFPDEFIPVAEQTGLITPLTTFVLGEALGQCREWHHAGLRIGVAVNIAARSLADSGFVEQVETMLARSGVDAPTLTLEMTESSIMGDGQQSIDALHALAALGVRLSVDDFGTGYSSLSYLQRLPVHELKVDRSFVFNVGTDANDRAIVRSIVELGQGLGLQVVAEGVENQLAWDRLVEMGCDIAQGYLLSRPMPAADLTAWLLRTASRDRSRATDPFATQRSGGQVPAQATGMQVAAP